MHLLLTNQNKSMLPSAVFFLTEGSLTIFCWKQSLQDNIEGADKCWGFQLYHIKQIEP